MPYLAIRDMSDSGVIINCLLKCPYLRSVAWVRRYWACDIGCLILVDNIRLKVWHEISRILYVGTSLVADVGIMFSSAFAMSLARIGDGVSSPWHGVKFGFIVFRFPSIIL